MTTVLAYIPSPSRGVWHLGPLPIRAYALFIIIGIVAALVIGDRRWEARGGDRGVIYDIALWAVPFGLVGGRLYHLATDWRTYWGPGGAGFGAALRIWDGGLGIWGAVALGGVGAWVGCRRRGIPLPAFGDAIAPGIILAQAIGRLGNYFNQELYGRETTVPWGLEIFYRRDPSGYVDPHSLDGVSTGQLAYVVQPTFLYELIWNLVVFAILIYVDRRFQIGHGRLFALYVALYCVGRFGVELLRNDTATLVAGIRINVFTSTFVFIGAVVYVILAPKGRENPTSLRGKVADEAARGAPAPVAVDEAATVASTAAASATASGAGKDDKPADSVKTEESAEATGGQPTEAEPVDAEREPADAVVPPEAEEPEVVEPESAAGEAEEPEAEEPEAEEAEAAAGEAEEPETHEQPKTEEPEAAELEAEEPVAVEPEVEEPEVEEPEAAADQAEEPEAVETDAEEPEAAEPEAVEPQTAEPDEPEAAEPGTAPSDDADTSEPQAEGTATESGPQEPLAPEPDANSDADAVDAAGLYVPADGRTTSGTAGSALRRLGSRLRNRRHQ